jgi:hypothetical protein
MGTPETVDLVRQLFAAGVESASFSESGTLLKVSFFPTTPSGSDTSKGGDDVGELDDPMTDAAMKLAGRRRGESP